MIVTATLADHSEIVKLARQEKFTQDFSNRIFSGPEAYEKGWIRVIRAQCNHCPHEQIIGFSCVRHKTREPETSLYFLGVDRDHRRRQIGTKLLEEVIAGSSHPRIVLSCHKENVGALAFYQRHGFVIAGEALEGAGHRLVKEW